MKKPYALLGLTLLLLINTANAQDTPHVIAHRGYWKAEGATQNSIRALQHAIRIGAYGSEFDVLVTADGIPIVNHDNQIDGQKIEDTPYKALRHHRLANGELLPSLRQYLRTGARQQNTRLILEIKTHSSPEKEKEAARIALAEVKRAKAQDMVDYISFSSCIADELVRLDPNARVFYLNGDFSPAEAKAHGYAGIDYHYNVLRHNPTWIDEAHQLGLEVNVWTVNQEDIMRWAIDQGIDYITTDEPEQLQALLNLTE